MEVVKDYEKKVIRLLASTVLSSPQLDEVIKTAELVGYEYTGSGYFIKIRHPYLPEAETVYSKPTIMGEAEGIEVGFVVFTGSKELTIECHSWGEKDVPEDFRDKDVQVRQLVL